MVGENSGETAQFGQALEMAERSSPVDLETKWRWVILSYILLFSLRRHLPVDVLDLNPRLRLPLQRALCHSLWLSYRERERVAESVARVALITCQTPKWSYRTLTQSPKPSTFFVASVLSVSS